ncbi:hypothetical protein VTK26DRAFT_4686 [Humicola hyalothermophila]
MRRSNSVGSVGSFGSFLKRGSPGCRSQGVVQSDLKGGYCKLSVQSVLWKQKEECAIPATKAKIIRGIGMRNRSRDAKYRLKIGAVLALFLFDRPLLRSSWSAATHLVRYKTVTETLNRFGPASGAGREQAKHPRLPSEWVVAAAPSRSLGVGFGPAPCQFLRRGLYWPGGHCSSLF